MRLRIFAGPNGSGKSMMFEKVRSTNINGRRFGLGHYFNADVIAAALRDTGVLDITGAYGFKRGRASLISFARSSGLMRDTFNEQAIVRGHKFEGSKFILLEPALAEAFAQLLTAWLCDLMLKRKFRFSFETVFSHGSKLDLMRKARSKGYKVYLYFIATNDVEINKDRIRTRVLQGGHDVPSTRVEKRYHLSIAHLVPALDLCYHAFIFDNSGEEPVMFAEMKETDNGRSWAWDLPAIPDWFISSYLIAQKDPIYLDVARKAIAARS